jgi:hypothetical protein
MRRKQVSNPQAKMVMIYSHEDRPFLRRSKLLDFLEGLANVEGWDFWWDEKMDHPLFDDEIKQQLDKAEVVVCLVSQSFLNSKYITDVEAKITFQRLVNEGVLVVPVMLSASLWEDTAWLKPLHHFPTNGYLQTSRVKNEIYLEITKYIRKWYHNRATTFREPKMVYRLRRLPEAALSKEQVKVLVHDSCERARKLVPDSKLRNRIATAAKASMKKNDVKALNKPQLEALDKQFLSRHSRKPDAEIVRWVLRCKKLHPQGRVVSRVTASSESH